MGTPDERRLGELAARIEFVDQHGTRGMESVRGEIGAVRGQIGDMRQDIGKLESSVERVVTLVSAMQLEFARTRPRGGQWLRDAALMVPMYALVVDLIIRGSHP